jgi:flagellar biosynthesis/type III secretory pathway chaperone
MNPSDIQPILQDITIYLEEFRQILLEEYEALSHTDLEQMQLTTVAKQKISDILDDLDNKRCQIFRNAGIQEKQLESSKVWQRIRTLTRECERLNTINGIVIGKQRRRAEITLSILQGKSAQDNLYSSQGNTVHAPQSSALGKV